MNPFQPRLIVEVGFSAIDTTAFHLDDPARGMLDAGRLAADIWTDIAESTKVESISTRRGSTRVDSPLVTYEAGHATITVDDPDRRYDPTFLDGPYVSAGQSQVTPMRRVRVRAGWKGVTYDLWSGFADDWDLDWDATKATVTLTATDAFKPLAARRRGPVAPVGAGEDAGARVHRILDSTGWPADLRQIGAGATALQATTLEGDPLAEAQLVADTEIGELYVNGAGEVVFRGRLALLTDARSAVSQGTFGHRKGVVELPLSTDDTQLYNEALITRRGGEQQYASDPVSMDEYLPKTFDRSDLLMLTDDEAAAYADWIVRVCSEPETRFDKIVLYPAADPDVLWPQVLGREIGDRITCVRYPPKGGPPLIRDSFIRGIAHEIGGGLWRTEWTLQSATRAGGWLVLDDLTLGRLDAAALAY